MGVTRREEEVAASEVVGGTWREREQVAGEEGIVFRAKKSRAGDERMTAWGQGRRASCQSSSRIWNGARGGVSGSGSGQRDI